MTTRTTLEKALRAAALALALLVPEAAAYRAADFHWLPPFLAVEAKPSLTFILDTSSSMLERAYPEPFDATRAYSGYFDPRLYYSYRAEGENPHFLVDNATGQWNGNFLNWAGMLRIDAARTVLSGGKFDAGTGCFEMQGSGRGPETLVFDDTEPRPDLSGRTAHMTPLRGPVVIEALAGESALLVAGAESSTRCALRVRGEPGRGLLQAVKGKARAALFTFEDPGNARPAMSDDPADLERIIETVNSATPQGGAPLAATLYRVYRHISQSAADSRALDPFYFRAEDQLAPCSRQKVILVSAGVSSGDHGVPAAFTSTAALKRDETEYALGRGGSTLLIDVAYIGHSTDLRPEHGMDGMQNWELYVISLAHGPDHLLLDAARHGKFRDQNGNRLPDLPEEFDADGDGLPDNYFPARTGLALKTAMLRALQLDASAVASGASPAVTSLSRSGEGVAYQAIFFPPAQTDRAAPAWSGQVHAYLVDAQGNLREDTNANRRLDLFDDRVIEFTRHGIYAHVDADGNGIIDDGERSAQALDGLTGIRFLWSTSAWLNGLTDRQAATQRTGYASAAPNRYILTFVDKNRNMVADGAGGEIQHFALPATPGETTLNSPEHFHNYLTLYESGAGTSGFDRTDPVQHDIHALREDNPSGFSHFQGTLAKRQVDFIRGVEIGNATVEGIADTVRNRLHGGSTWRLGDIVHSSPAVVGRPTENYHLIYNDRTYEKFLKRYLHRRQVVYVGANDGMLHAFNGGFWDPGTRSLDTARDGRTEFELGQELWAYVPYNLLPHLKWLMHPEYGESLHVPYMDLPPRVFDARIFFMSDGVTSVDEDKYPGGWGTVLVAGMRLGGAAMEVDIDKTDGDSFNEAIDRTVSSAYVIMDVTDPESPPGVLAEISLPGQGFTTCVPTVMPMTAPNAQGRDANTWYMVFGSGPADADGRADGSKLMHGSSDQPGRLFVLDLNALAVEKTIRTVDGSGLPSSRGAPFAHAEAGSFISAPVCADLDIGTRTAAGKMATDLVYFGTVAGDSASPAGKVYRLRTGNGPPGGWETSILVDAGEPVSAAPAVTVDEQGRVWVHFGTGRLFHPQDLSQASSMAFYGTREPESAGIRTWNTVPAERLFDSSRISVTQGSCGEDEYSEGCVGIVQAGEGGSIARDWAWLTSVLEQAPGWKHGLNAPGERVLDSPAILGGSAVFASFVPARELCSPGGASRLWSLHYKTGTPYFWPSLHHPGAILVPFIEIGPGPAASPILHVGDKQAVTAFSQLASGDVTRTDINTPLPFKSGCMFWRKNTD